MTGSVQSDPVVLDASAVLAWLRGEPGAAVVDPLLSRATVCAVNWSEIWQKLHQHGADAERVTQRLRVLGVRVEPLSTEDAVAAARLWQATRQLGLSLADRCCLALAERLGQTAVTADGAWTGLGGTAEVRVIR